MFFFIQDNYYYIKIIKNFKKCYPIYETFNIEFYIKLREEHIHKKKKKTSNDFPRNQQRKKLGCFGHGLKQIQQPNSRPILDYRERESQTRPITNRRENSS